MGVAQARIRVLIAAMILFLAVLACDVPPQDCWGVTFNVEGTVVDTQGIPIAGTSIRAWNDGSYERDPINLTATSDADGTFSTGSGFSYACTTFDIEVTADGFETYTATFYPPSSAGWSVTLPPDFTVQLQPDTD